MSSFLCFVCHSTVNADTNEETREKYREVIGMNLCPDSHLCYICCYFLNKMWMFKSICLKRSLEYPVLFSEKGTINLHRSETLVSILCPEDICLQHLNTRYHFYNNNDNSQSDFDDNNYCELQDDRNFDINDTLLKAAPIENFRNEDYLFVTKDNIEDNLFNEELCLPNLEPVRITQNDLIDGKWTENVPKNYRNRNNSLLELHNWKNDVNIEGIVVPVIAEDNHEPNIINDNNASIVLSINEKDEHTIGSTVTENFQDVIAVHNLHFGSNTHCYGQLDNHANVNVDNNIYEKQSNSISKNLERMNLNESVTSVNESLTNIKESVINIHESVTNTKESINNSNESVTDVDESVANTNAPIINTNQYASNSNETNTKACVINTNESVNNMQRNEINIIENIPNDTNSEEDNAPVDDNPSDTEESTNQESTEMNKVIDKKDLYEKVFLTLEQQKAELDKARKDEKYIAAALKCHSCAMYFHFKDTYQTHMMRHEESNGEHSCTICSLRFANLRVLRSHRANHSVRFKCRVCSEEVRPRQRPTHARACVGERESVNCHQCGKIFQSVELFQQHMQRYHGTERSNKTYLCNVCGKSFNTRGRVRTHMITHINRKFDCDLCMSTFSSPYTLNQHRKSKHLTSEPQLHRCTTCNVTYNSRKSLLGHLRNSLAHKESVYKCNICGRTCPTAASLSRHTAGVHTHSRHLACRHCHKRYSTSKSLAHHMLNHKEGKSVPLCHSCGMTFKSTTVLKKHLRNVCEKDTRKNQIVMEEELLQVPFF